MGNIINQETLPDKYPTSYHDADFWESLGRAVATFGFLEQVLGKAIFAFTATRPYEETEIEQALGEWVPKLECALSDPLGNLINAYGKSVRDHPEATINNLDILLNDLREASEMRNILCHGSWGLPDMNGASLPFFMNRQKEVVTIPMDRRFIDQVQQHTANLAYAVINTVTHMGWQFPSSMGPGNVWKNPPSE